MRSVGLLVFWIAYVLASENVFSVNDDIYAFPQYDVVFSTSYISHDDASVKLEKSKSFATKDKSRDVSSNEEPESVLKEHVDYDYLVLNSRPYLCSFPQVEPLSKNESEKRRTPAEQEKELVRAADRGKTLLQDMEGNQCLFYSTGWWTYSFCYNSYVKQFHAMSPTANGGRVWPPQEDPTTPSYVLGKYEKPKDLPASLGELPHQSSELQTKADTTYLTQYLSNGTPCDLTGKARRIEIQFHCNPQLTDRIGLIKETSTCAYLMVVYTPRLCNDIAFLPPQETKAHAIECQEILTEEEIEEVESRKTTTTGQESVEEPNLNPVMVGDIQVGALKLLGPDGMKLQRGRIVMTPEEKAEIVIQQKDGHVQGMSRADLKRLRLDPSEIEQFKKELEKMANGKDWKIERVDAPDGQIQLRGVVAADEKAGERKVKKEDREDEVEEGSEEIMKDEL